MTTDTATQQHLSEAAAKELLRQHATGEPFSALGGPLALASTEAAYHVQDAYVALLLRQRKTTLAGYKIALTTPAMREMVGFHDSVSGRLFSDQLYQAGQAIAGAAYGRLIIEFEIAFRMARDLPTTDTPWTGASILEYVACAYPALEIADDRRADYATLKASILTLVADNAWNQGLVLGPACTCGSLQALADIQGIARIDGQEVGRGSGRDVLGNPADALAWLANSLADRRLTLRAGDLVTTGSLVKSQFPVAGQRVEFLLPSFGSVELAIT